ncbi:hypothetical protein HMPREF3218_0200994 [Prevotella bivia]|nr:hypothetical protein HMPREF3218_0200994 [Prevotella bivia]
MTDLNTKSPRGLVAHLSPLAPSKGAFLLQMLKTYFTIKKDSIKFSYYPKK